MLQSEIPCVILSGGKSSRMQEDKSLLAFSGYKSFAEYQYIRLKPFFKEIFISSKSNKFYFINDKHLILDENKTVFSPILALNTILKTLNSNKVFIIPVDTPFVKIQSIEKLIQNSDDVEICIAKTQKTHNLCGVFTKSINSFIEDMIKNDIYKINHLINNCKSNFIEFENEDEFLNVNDKKDYDKSLRIINSFNN